MKIKKSQIKGIDFFYRENTSDIKTFEEVIGRDVYQKRQNKINKKEKWYDLGGNVGAFALLANSLGAVVEIFEPDPFNCEILEMNLKLNGFRSKINQCALVHNRQIKKTNLYVGNNNSFWRNSIVKKWNSKGIVVPCVNFDDVIEDNTCVKMDIEGAEMPILETTNRRFQKLIFEWSFDIDPSLERYWGVLDKLKKNYNIRCSEFKNKGVTIWPKSWFPACENVFCYEKN